MSVCTIIPAYNAEAFLHKAIDSVLNQTVPVDEIIVIDDGSKDSTCAVVESYGSRVRLIRQQNAGPAAARNLGVKSSNSGYIAFLDADDAWQPRKIEKQLAAFAANPGAVLCYTGVTHVHTEGWQEDFPGHPPETLRSELRIGNPRVVPSCVMVSRAAFLRAGGFDISLKCTEDWDFALAILDCGPFCAISEPLTLYQVHTSGVSSNAESIFLETKRKMLDRRLLAGLHGPSRWAWRRRILSHQAYKVACTIRTANQPKELRYLLYSVLLWPSPWWHPIRFKALGVTLKNRLQMRPVSNPAPKL